MDNSTLIKEIKLTFDKDKTRLIGHALGRKTYTNQIKSHVDFNGINTIIIPDSIRIISISFINGLTKEIFEHIPRSSFNKHFKFKANDKILDRINQAIYI